MPLDRHLSIVAFNFVSTHYHAPTCCGCCRVFLLYRACTVYVVPGTVLYCALYHTIEVIAPVDGDALAEVMTLYNNKPFFFGSSRGHQE